MKNILVLGATGKCGKKIIEKLLNIEDYNVTAFSLTCSKTFENTDNLFVFDANAMNTMYLNAAIKNQDVIICSLKTKDIFLITEKLINLVNPNQRLIFLASTNNVSDKKYLQEEKRAISLLELSSLNYTIIRTSDIIDGSVDNCNIFYNCEDVDMNLTNMASVLKVVDDIISDSNKFLKNDITLVRKV